jgi:serine/threonine protein kinase
MIDNEIIVNGNVYHIIKLLGKGKGGYSYLATCNNTLVVVKKIHHEPCSYYTFSNKIQSEYNDYHRLKDLILMPRMLDIDFEKEIIIKEYIEGETIFEKVVNDLMDEDYIKQVQQMCKVLYLNNINIDYFPTNFVVQNGSLYYVDYECNNYMEEWNFENWGIKYWSKTKEFLNHLNKEK